MAGSGDMMPEIIERSAALGISDKFLFTGFLRGKDVDRAYRMADVYVMPSVSEPFGITALEAIKNDVPIVISKQSGASEVIKNCLKVDFWDVEELANKIYAVIKHNALSNVMRKHAKKEIGGIRWDHAADKLDIIYRKLHSKSYKELTSL